MQIELKRLQRETGITFVFVTHDQEEALTMSDRIAVMNQGRVLQVGTPREIYDHPAERFVADFIGETNMLERVAGAAATAPGTVRLGASGPSRGARPAGRRAAGAVTVVVRPEHAGLAPRSCGAPARGIVDERGLFRHRHPLPSGACRRGAFIVRRQNAAPATATPSEPGSGSASSSTTGRANAEGLADGQQRRASDAGAARRHASRAARWLLPALLILAFAAVGPLLIVLVYSFLTPGPYGGVSMAALVRGLVQGRLQRDIFDDSGTGPMPISRSCAHGGARLRHHRPHPGLRLSHRLFHRDAARGEAAASGCS